MLYDRDRLRWNGWGLEDRDFDLRGRSQEAYAYVAEMLHIPPLRFEAASTLEGLGIQACRLSEEDLRELQEALGEDELSTDLRERARHAAGRSYPDLLRLRRGELEAAPDAVAYPSSHEGVEALLRKCGELGIEVVPYGGGSSVVGGVTPEASEKVISLDTTELTQLIDLDPVSRTATFEAGIYGPALEAALEKRGYTLGHYPQSFEFSTLGGWIAARGAGQQSNRYGAADKWLVAARVATPTGEVRTKPFPHSAAGPDLKQLIAGSEGTIGVITEATFKIHPIPAKRDYRAYLFSDFEAGALVIRDIARSEIPVAMMRLSDADETRFFGEFKGVLKPPSKVTELGERALSMAGLGDGRCVLMIGCEGEAAEVALSVAQTAAIAVGRGGLPVGKGPGESWYAQRFEMPYLRDPLLDRGVGVDTLETSTSWANLSHLYEEVRGALRGALPETAAILTHISHSYADGASLYFTFVFPMEREAPYAQWRKIKTAASDAISEAGGTISHHHGVGKDHAPWMTPEVGRLGLRLLREAKRAVDPNDVMNPGKLFPEE